MYELTGFTDRVAVVTGAGRMRSTGRPIAVELARAGCDVVLTGSGRKPSEYPPDEKAAGWGGLESVADEVRSFGRRALPIIADVADLTKVEELAASVLEEFGRVDIVVNNAAAPRGPDRYPVVDLDPAAWHKVIDVNLHGTFNMSRTFARLMIAAGNGGSIVNISSIAGKLMGANTAAYSVSKVGIYGLTSAMAGELGPFNVRVNAICVGTVDTSRIDDVPRGSPQWLQLLAPIPLGRGGDGNDVAAMTVFLCSDQGSWITGQQINVDGGQVTTH